METTTKLKKMILSQDLTSQNKCIRFMIHVLRDPTNFDYISTKFLDDDLIQFLCEPLLSIKTSLLQNICLCIWMLSKNQKFYERNDVLYTCNSLMRTLVFLLKTKNPVSTSLIQLLAIFLKKGGKNLREACNLTQVLTIVKMILVNSASLPDCCTINSVSILTTILSCPLVELNGKLYSTTISVSKSICKIIAENNIIEPHVVSIASDISSSILRFYSTIMKRIQLNANLTQHRDVIEPLKSVAWYMIKNASLPFVQKNLNSNVYRKIYYKGLKCLISPFDVTLPSHILHNVTNQYATQGMIKVSYELLESSDLGALAEQLLLNIIYRLAIANLEVELYWPGGLKMFYNQLVEGFRQFPKTPKDICATLINNKKAYVSQTVIIFIYFCFLTCSNADNESLYLESICVYLYSNKNQIPIPLLKAILFNISISFVSHHAVNTIPGLPSATKKLVELLTSIENVDIVFTLHPAQLYFMFASNLFPVYIKLRLVRLWIMNLDDIASNEIEKLCLNNCDSKYCLLDVLINEKEMDVVKMNKGFSIVNSVIIQERNSNKHDTVLFIWDLLPKCLGSFCCAEELLTIGENNLLCLLNLAEAYPPPEELNWTLNAQRNTAYTISSIIKCHQLKSLEYQNLLSSLLQHILTIIRLSTADATNTIKMHKDFPSILADLCLSERNSVCFLSFEILIKLCQRPQTETSLLHSMTLQHRHILTAMCRMCHNCVVSSVTLFQIIIQRKEKNERNFVELEEIHDVEFLKSVFLQLETIISLGLDWVSDHSWQCMETVLSADFSSYPHLQELQYDFAADPWLYLLIRNLKNYSEKCIEFLMFWFRRFVLSNEGKKYIVHGKSILCTSFLDKTVVHISITLINQTYKNKIVMAKAKEIIQLILECKITAILPEELLCKMKTIVQK